MPSQTLSSQTRKALITIENSPENSKQHKLSYTNAINGNNTTEVTVESVSCVYTNADQFRNKLNELKIQISLEDPDFMLVTEVLLFISYRNYSAFPSSGKGRGVIIYAKSDLNVSPLSFEFPL